MGRFTDEKKERVHASMTGATNSDLPPGTETEMVIMLFISQQKLLY